MFARILMILVFCFAYGTAQASVEPSFGNGIKHNSQHSNADVPIIDLRDRAWESGEHFRLDGLWHAYWGQLLSPDNIHESIEAPITFPVPGVWTHPPENVPVLSALGFMTYQTKVLVPPDQSDLFLYIPDMPSAYTMWVNGEIVSRNGDVATTAGAETPGFLPKTVRISEHHGELDIVLQLSNFHYREGGVWFSLKLTDESGIFSLKDRPILFAVFAGAILIAIGIYNCLLFAFRSTEIAALNFGLLCLIVGVRRLLIDERVVYMFDLFSWATLQRLEHLCFYVALPLFMGFFVSLFPQNLKFSITRMAWLLVTPFILICLAFPARIYTELNVAFQVLIVISVVATVVMYLQALRRRGSEVAGFGISLLVLFMAVVHDVLKANDILDTPNIAHFGVFAFVITQSIAFQRRYLNSLKLVETMSSELTERNRELLEMDEFKDEFLANTSHELRTPLHGISGLAKVLQDSDQGQLTDEQRNKIGLIANTSKRLSLLVNDILDFSSIKHNKLNLNPTDVDLESIADLVIKTLRPVVGDKDVALSAQIDWDVRYIHADEYRLQQILFNLMGNAVKFTHEGFVQLIVYVEDEEIILKIEDSGVGIPKEKMHTLFRPFEQAHVDGELAAGGTGLGLSISRQLVELHQGSLEIESACDQGTTVKIRFPLTMAVDGQPATNAVPDSLAEVRMPDPIPTEEAVLSEPEYDAVPCDGPLIYVVDDELVNRELVTSQLKGEGYQIETFADGISFLARLSERVPDLVLLDFMMPRMNGLEVCQTVRRQYDSYEVPIMMLTARHQISDIIKALGAGANDYLIKPYHDQELIARVQSQLSVRKYWIANRENQKLKHEIERREALEEELSELNSRLLNVLDISDELILLANSQLKVVYSNQRAVSSICGTTDHTLTGKSIHDIVNEDLSNEIQRILAERNQTAFTLETIGSTPDTRWHVTLKCFMENDSVYVAIVINPLNSVAGDIDPASAIAGLTKELSESRNKINQIEGALKKISSFPPSAAEGQQPEPAGADSGLSANSMGGVVETVNKELIVSLHRVTLNLWERYSSKGKAELAEQSRCWRVYIDGTTVKTRTFDKYLSVKTIPDKPRWRSVVRTANYVLSHCSLNDDDRNELQSLSESVEDLFS